MKIELVCDEPLRNSDVKDKDLYDILEENDLEYEDNDVEVFIF